MKIYNSLTKKEEEFKPISDNVVTIYSCGPTVYNYAHIGNLRTYINTDILRRALISCGYTVKQAMNITDIEDKIIKTANDQGVEISAITSKYEKAFLDDLEKLNIEKVEYYPHATTEIPEMIEIIKALLEKGFAYKSEDGSVYFSIEKFKKYGELSGLDTGGIKAGARVDQDEYDKESARDFVLWKAKKDDEPSWDTPFGVGRPGWHIECSAMSMKYLRETIDIHTGGVDLLFPHHENEIAQSEAYTGKKFVNFWFHGEFLLVNGQKMSKSLNNIYTLDEISKKYKVSPLAYRMLCLMSHYREKLNFTDDSIVQAQKTLDNLRDFATRLREVQGVGKNLPIDVYISEADASFYNAIDDDLNTPKALAVIFNFIKEINKAILTGIGEDDAKSILDFLSKVDQILGLELNNIQDITIPDEVNSLLEKRKSARENKDFESSDKLRDEINRLGFEVEDTPNGQTIRSVK